MIHLTCPGCQAVFEVDDNFAGEKVECYNCKTKFIVPGLPATEITSQVSVPEENAPVESSPVLPVNENTPVGDEKACPFCGKTIKKVAIKCKHCQTFLKSEEKSLQSAIHADNKDILRQVKKPFKVNKKLIAVSGFVGVIVVIIAVVIAIPYFESAKSQYERGLRYEKGNGVAQDSIKATELYRKAAEQGSLDAMVALGRCYCEGIGVEKNPIEMIEWYRKAAEQGAEGAQLKLGNWYAFGDGVESDQEEAVKWWRKSAEQGGYKTKEIINNLDAAKQGNVDAQNWLGNFYSGDGQTASNINMTEAVKWYLKAAEQGNVDAQYKLSHCYSSGGRGFAKDEVKAKKWLRKAAENGNADAQCSLWWYFREDAPKEALKWLKKSAAQGNKSAIKDLESYQKSAEEARDKSEVASRENERLNLLREQNRLLEEAKEDAKREKIRRDEEAEERKTAAETKENERLNLIREQNKILEKASDDAKTLARESEEAADKRAAAAQDRADERARKAEETAKQMEVNKFNGFIQ